MTLFFVDPNHFCTVLPIGTVTMTGTTISAVNMVSGGNCPGGAPDVQAWPQSPYCAIAGINSASGTFTIFDQPSGGSRTSTGVTASFGTAAINTTVTGTGTFSYSAGDKITVSGTTQTGETVGACSFSWNY
jgi:hypothetical protein